MRLIGFSRQCLRALAGLLTVALCFTGREAAAHPHIFIDSGVQLNFDDAGRLAGLRVVWVYDAFYSMLLLEEMGLDPEFTGQITEEEKQELTGFDMQWIEGYDGDLYVLKDGQALMLSGPHDWTADVENGRIISTHLRRLEVPLQVADDPVLIQVYDPTYYTAYMIAAEPQIAGREDCEAQVHEPDTAAATELLEATLAELLAREDADPEEDFPEIGSAFADEIRLTCAP